MVIQPSCVSLAAEVEAALVADGFVIEPPLRFAFDGRDGCLVLEWETDGVFGSARQWGPLWVGKTPVDLTAVMATRESPMNHGTRVGYLDPRELADRYLLDGRQQTLERQIAALTAERSAARTGRAPAPSAPAAQG